MTQLIEVHDHLKKHGKITAWDAIRLYRITRLAEYIRQLRSEGNYIETQRLPNSGETGGTYAVYHLKPASK
jgi:hypothetical protein